MPAVLRLSAGSFAADILIPVQDYIIPPAALQINDGYEKMEIAGIWIDKRIALKYALAGERRHVFIYGEMMFAHTFLRQASFFRHPCGGDTAFALSMMRTVLWRLIAGRNLRRKWGRESCNSRTLLRAEAADVPLSFLAKEPIT